MINFIEDPHVQISGRVWLQLAGCSVPALPTFVHDMHICGGAVATPYCISAKKVGGSGESSSCSVVELEPRPTPAVHDGGDYNQLGIESD